MKIFKICLLFLISSSNVLAVTPEEFEKVASQFKMIDNSKKKIPELNFKTKDGNITLYFNKTYDEDGYFVSPIVLFNNKVIYQQDKYWHGISNYDIHSSGVICYDRDSQLFSTLSIIYSDIYKKQKSIVYGLYLFRINDKTPRWENSYSSSVSQLAIFGPGSDAYRYTYIPYNPKEFFPYYNEEKVLERLYETGTCDREVTKKANIQVLVNGKWTPQEESWNIKKERPNSKTKVIQTKKQYLYTTPNKKTKMYLIKGDKVTLLNEQTDENGQKWYFINYKGKKDLNMWIKAEAVEFSE